MNDWGDMRDDEGVIKIWVEDSIDIVHICMGKSGVSKI